MLLLSQQKKHRSSAMLTINDHPQMRQVFGEFRAERVQIAYTVGGGGARSKAANELIYRTW